jgi:O-antigen/teichoic acid export membrane protein
MTTEIIYTEDVHPPAPTASPAVASNSGLLSVAAGIAGALSYACTLLMAHSLGSAQFSDFAAGQMLLGIVGTIASALVPLPLSHAVAAHPAGSTARREGIAFAVLVSTLVGVIAAAVTGAVTAAFAPLPVAEAVAFSALVLFMLAAPFGWLQGELRFVRYAVMSAGEIAVRLVFSVLVVLLSWGATGGILGYAIGALAVLVVPVSFYRDLRWWPGTLKQRWRWAETGDVALALCVVSVVVGLDIVVMSFLDAGSDAAAGFQALATFAKAPVYIAAGTALVAFPLLRSPATDTISVLASALRSFGQLSLAAAAVIATAPHALMALVLPHRYYQALGTMPWLAAAGIGYATLTVLATILLGLKQYRRCQLGLIAAAVLIPIGILAGWHVGGVNGLAVGSALGALLSAGVLGLIALPHLPAGSLRTAIKGVLAGSVLTAILAAVSIFPVLWLVAVMILGAAVLALQRSDNPAGLRLTHTAQRWMAARRFPRIPPRASSFGGFVLITAIAFGVRAIGVVQAFELWVDEMLYADLGRAVSFGQIPNLPDGPFFLHPPGFFLVEGLVIRAFHLSGSSLDLVYDLRWLNVAIGALTAGVAFLLVRKLARMPAACSAAGILIFEPFVLRNNGRVFIETLGMAAVLAGLLILVVWMKHRTAKRGRIPLIAAGLLLGYGVVTKDVFALAALVPIVLAVLWRRTIAPRHAALVLTAAAVPYTTYLIVLTVQGMFPEWWWAKTNGVHRFLGFEQTTGFNAEGSPSLIMRMLEQAAQYSTSYLLLGLGPLAAVVLCFSRRSERRLIGLAGLILGLFGLYSAAFGTFEEQYGYPVLVTGALCLTILASALWERRPRWRKPTAVVGVVFLGLTLFLGMRAVTTQDHGYAQVHHWVEQNLPNHALVSVTNSTGEFAFADDPRFGVWPSAELMEKNNVDYILTQSLPTMHGYGYAQPEMLKWLSQAATPVVSFEGPTNGATTLWVVDEKELRDAAKDRIGFPSKTYETEQ